MFSKLVWLIFNQLAGCTCLDHACTYSQQNETVLFNGIKAELANFHFTKARRSMMMMTLTIGPRLAMLFSGATVKLGRIL